MHPSSPARRVFSAWQPTRWPVIALLALAASAPARAEQGSEDELLRWVPALAFSFDNLGHKASGAIQTNNVQGPPLTDGGCLVTVLGTPSRNGTLCPDSPFPVTNPSSSTDTDIVPIVNASLELSTPRLFRALFSPRLFVHGDAAISFAFERNLAGERKPGPFFTDPLQPTDFDIAEGSVGGQGSRAKLQLRPFVIGAGGGIAFTMSLFGRTLRLKPSFEYLREEFDLIASVHRAVKQRSPTISFGDFRLIDLHTSSTETLHGLGGGLELELDASRFGPLGMSIFILGRGYRYTGNLNHTFYQANQYGEAAVWRFELDPWSWRAGVGVRFRWLPE
jgi:hypothetical protein